MLQEWAALCKGCGQAESQAMAVTVPDWLKQRGGTLKLASDGQTWYVRLNPMLQYAVAPKPVADRFGCSIKQTNNGKTVDCQRAAATAEEAVAEGLEELRKYLGW